MISYHQIKGRPVYPAFATLKKEDITYDHES